MGLRLVVHKGIADPRHDRSWLLRQRTLPPALRTGLLLIQLLRLLLRRHLQRAGQQRPHRGHGHLFHLRQIDIQPRPLLAPLLPHNDFSPTPSEFLDPANIL